MPEREGIAERLSSFLDDNAARPGASMLRDSVDYGVTTLGFDADAWVHELTDSVIGDQYPVPDRMLDHIEKVVHAYLVREMCAGQQPEADFDLLATEGGTAAMSPTPTSRRCSASTRRTRPRSCWPRTHWNASGPSWPAATPS